MREQLRRYANLRIEDSDQADKAKHWGRPARNDNLFRSLARQRVRAPAARRAAVADPGFHYTIRDFRLMMSVALPGDADDLAAATRSCCAARGDGHTLRSASLPNRVCDAADLINWCSLFANPDRIIAADAPDLHYDDGREIRDQIVDFDTIQDAAGQRPAPRGRKAAAPGSRRASTRSSPSPSASRCGRWAR